MILDSGDRTEFKSGAVRDIKTENGRCDLLPLDTISEVFEMSIPKWIDKYQRTGDTGNLVTALKEFIDCAYIDDEIYKNNEPIGRWCTAMLDLSIHYKEGAEKYEENNWKKGIPCKSYIDSAMRHYFKWLRGDEDEHHERAFMWNIIGCIWTEKEMPELGVKGSGVRV